MVLPTRRLPPSGGSGVQNRRLLLGIVIGLAAGWALMMAMHSQSTAELPDSIGRKAVQQTQERQPVMEAALQRSRRPEATLPIEVYARGISDDQAAIDKVATLLNDKEKKELRELCGRTLYHSLQTGWVTHETGAWTFVATGAV